MKKIAFITALLLLAVLFSSCNSIQKAAVLTVTPTSSPPATISPSSTQAPDIKSTLSPSPAETVVSPELAESSGTDNRYYLGEIPDLKTAGIDGAKYDKIYTLLYGALSISEENVVFFDNADSLSVNNLLGFAYVMLSNTNISLSVQGTFADGPVDKNTVKNIIRSAFGVNYTPKKGDSYRDGLKYTRGSFDFTSGGYQLREPYIYSVTRQLSGRLLIKFNIVFIKSGESILTSENTYIEEPDEADYCGKGEAVIKEDAASLFGYRLISLKHDEDTDIAFTHAEASSSLPADGSKVYDATNAIDGKDNTAWATDKGPGEWIKLSFDKPQDITGLILHFGDWSSDEVLHESGTPTPCSLEFSDGTVITSVFDDYAHDTHGDPCIAFGKVITTTYVKIIIYVETRTGDAPPKTIPYISEVKPF